MGTWSGRWKVILGVLAAVGFIVTLLVSFRGGDPTKPNAPGIIVVAAPLPTPTPTPTPMPTAIAEVEDALLRKMTGAAGSNAQLAGVRIVDVERGIACASVSDRRRAGQARVVWIGSTETLVTDDGGPDFAILVGVCDPNRPGRR